MHSFFFPFLVLFFFFSFVLLHAARNAAKLYPYFASGVSVGSPRGERDRDGDSEAGSHLHTLLCDNF